MKNETKWFLACCDDDGVCIGYLTKNNNVCENPDNNIENLMSFTKKQDASAKVMQINLSKSLLPNGYPFRVVAVKG